MSFGLFALWFIGGIFALPLLVLWLLLPVLVYSQLRELRKLNMSIARLLQTSRVVEGQAAHRPAVTSSRSGMPSTL